MIWNSKFTVKDIALDNDNFARVDMIPRTIWQTYISESQIPASADDCRRTWYEQNPDWQLMFVDDGGVRQLFEGPGREYLDVFDLLPHGVMKADFWRYAIIYYQGGFYCDLDTTCNTSLEDWIDCEGDKAYIACENTHPFFCQWAFGAPAGHPMLKSVLDLIKYRVIAEGGVNVKRPSYVHYYTGPGVWTAGIKRYLEAYSAPQEIQSYAYLWEDKAVVIYPDGEFTWRKISHLFASYNWKSEDYFSWQRIREDHDATQNPDVVDQIPKIIHQTWRSPVETLPPVLQSCVESFSRQNPGWEHRFYTDEDHEAVIAATGLLDVNDFRAIASGVERADIFRCAALYLYGGIYADVDMESIRPLDQLLASACDAGLLDERIELLLTIDHPIHNERLNRKEFLMNHFMVAKPGAKFMRAILTEMGSLLRLGKLSGGDPVHSTGPGLFTRKICEAGGAENLAVGTMPWQWIHPLPDMVWGFPEMEFFDGLIQDKTWRRHYSAFTAHYWWHNYANNYSILNKYEGVLFSD